MADTLTRQQRHECMSHIRSKDTGPEVKLRKELHRLGYRYRINVKSLPGTPDIVLPKYRSCIFVNGCFWHGHKGCSKFVIPKSNTEFWEAKIRNNHERDLKEIMLLEAYDWKVIVVWECQLKKESFDETVAAVRKQLDENREAYTEYVADRRKMRKEWQEEMKRRRQKAGELMEELEKFTITSE